MDAAIIHILPALIFLQKTADMFILGKYNITQSQGVNILTKEL